jgi:hypothetical protein
MDLTSVRAGDDTTAVTYSIAQRILATSETQTAEKLAETGGVRTPAEGAFVWLHTLIAGELDVDRCDYVLRDARSYGFDSARFDLQRLIDNFVVVQSKEADNALVPAVRPDGQSAVEAFLIARARIYQWGTRHHKVGQVAAALRYATSEVLRPVLEGKSEPHSLSAELTLFVDDIAGILKAAKGNDDDERRIEDLLKRFGGYDDQWWMGVLRKEELRRTHDREWFSLVCWRTRGPRTLWKRVLDFPLAEEDQSDWNEQLVKWNEGLPKRADLGARDVFDEAVRDLHREGILVIRHDFEPWRPSATTRELEKPKSALCFHDRRRGLVPVTDVSQPVEALREGWMRDLQVQAFARSDVELSEDLLREVLARLTSEKPVSISKLEDIFRQMEGESYETRQELEAAVLEVFNRHIADFPVGYTYKDAIEGARSLEWLRTTPPGQGVKVVLAKQDLRDELASATIA